MQSVAAHPRDPAPSRLRYRLHRLWLTPRFRFLIRYGLPVLVLSVVAAAILAPQENRHAIEAYVADLRRTVEDLPEFTVQVMAIDGASDDIGEDIREIVPVDFPISSFDLDLEGMRERIAELDAVARVDVRVRAGGVLQIDIVERQPAAIWRIGDDLELLDRDGHRVAALGARLDRPDLPLLAGQGAETAVGEALSLIAAARPVAGRLRGLVRMGERRWDIVLDHGQRILLPEKQPMQALEQVMALQVAQDLLDRDVALVDFRNPARPVVRKGRAEPLTDDELSSDGNADE